MDEIPFSQADAYGIDLESAEYTYEVTEADVVEVVGNEGS